MKFLVLLLVVWVGDISCSSVSDSRYCQVERIGMYEYSDEAVVWCDAVPRSNIFNGSDLLNGHDIISILNTKVVPLGPTQCCTFSDAKIVIVLHTDLKELPQGCFDSFPYLEELDLGWNSIEVIPKEAFPSTVNVQRTGHCGHIASIWSPIRRLILRSNKVHTIEDDSLKASSLKYLDLSDNNIRDIDNKFKDLSGLKRLLLHSNQIEYLTRESLAGLTDMDYLVLDFNPIKHISGDAFFSLKNLKTLHLTRTGLTTLGMLIRQPNMEALQNLAYLDVDFNKLESLPQDLISALPSIIRIDVTNNTWRCDGKIKHLQDFMKTRKLFWLTVPRCYYPADMRGTEVENYTVPLFNPHSTVMTNKGSTSLMLNTSLASSAWRNSTEVASSPTTASTSTPPADMGTQRLHASGTSSLKSEIDLFTSGVPVLVFLAITICDSDF